MQIVIESGAGEVHLNAVDRDGTLSGPDINLIKHVAPMVDIPLIYSGGLESVQSIKRVLGEGVDAVGVGAFFVFEGVHRAVLITYLSKKQMEEIIYG